MKERKKKGKKNQKMPGGKELRSWLMSSDQSPGDVKATRHSFHNSWQNLWTNCGINLKQI